MCGSIIGGGACGVHEEWKTCQDIGLLPCPCPLLQTELYSRQKPSHDSAAFSEIKGVEEIPAFHLTSSRRQKGC